MTAADSLGHLFYLFLLVGQLAVAQKLRGGFLLRIVGSLGWAAVGWHLGLSSILLWSLGFAVVDFTGWDSWRQDGSA